MRKKNNSVLFSFSPHLKKTNNKKGNSGIFGLMVTASIALVVIFLVFTIGADIMSDVQDTQTENGTSFNVSGFGLTAMANVSSQGGNIGLIAGMAFLLLVLVALFTKVMGGFGGRM